MIDEPLSYSVASRSTNTQATARHASGESRLTPFNVREELARIHPDAFAWAMRCCRSDRPEAEDVLHEAYSKVLDGRALFEGKSTFKTWLFGVIRRTASEQARWGWLRLARLERWWGQSMTQDHGGERQSSGDDERVGDLRVALTRLSPRQQQIVHLVFYQDLTIQEAAVVLAMPIGTARTHYERGKARLRQLLLGSGEL